MIILLGLTLPFKDPGLYKLELFNEVVIMLGSYHLFMFTDYVGNPQTRYLCGMSLVFVATICILFNLGSLVKNTLRKVYLEVKKKWITYKKKKMLLLRRGLNLKKDEQILPSQKEIIFSAYDKAYEGGKPVVDKVWQT